jgi:hypothetical protein
MGHPMTKTQNATVRLGLVSLGQGPRPEYDLLHRRLFAGLGLAIEPVSRHVLDGLSASEIAALAADPAEPAIHCNVRGPGTTPSPLGSDWHARWLGRDRLLPHLQRCVDELENAGVAATICCVAEPFPDHGLSTRRPLVFPADVMLAHAAARAATAPGMVLGLIAHGDRQRSQQRAALARLPWAQQVNVVFGAGDSLEASVDDLNARGAALIQIWAFAAGLGPKDPPGRLAGLVERSAAPVVVPAVAAAMFTRGFLSPPFTGAEA